MKLILTLIVTFVVSAASAKVDFTKPKDGEVVPQTFPVEFTVEGMTLAKAGVLTKGTGHHHLIVDGKPIKKGLPVPKNDTHIHYGDASSSTTLTLKPGKHTLTLQFADGNHVSLGEEYSKTITITVK